MKLMTNDVMLAQRAKQAAKDYVCGARLRVEQAELSDRMLAKKFECAPSTIKRTKAHGKVTVLTEEEQQLVRQCAREHDRLERQTRYLTKPYLAIHYGIPVCAIDRELAVLNFSNPLNRKDKSREDAA